MTRFSAQGLTGMQVSSEARVPLPSSLVVGTIHFLATVRLRSPLSCQLWTSSNRLPSGLHHISSSTSATESFPQVEYISCFESLQFSPFQPTTENVFLLKDSCDQVRHTQIIFPILRSAVPFDNLITGVKSIIFITVGCNDIMIYIMIQCMYTGGGRKSQGTQEPGGSCLSQHLSLTPNSLTPYCQLEINYIESVYTMKLSKCCKSGFSSHLHPREQVYQHILNKSNKRSAKPLSLKTTKHGQRKIKMT